MKALGVDTEDDIYLLSNYFLKGPGEGEQAEEGSEKGAKDEEMVEEKEGMEEASGGVDEGEKKDDEGSVVLSVDEKASDSSSVKAHLSGKKAVVLIIVCTQPLSTSNRYAYFWGVSRVCFAAFAFIWFKKPVRHT